MKKTIVKILGTSAAALGLFAAGASAANASTTYTVKSGDTVSKISQKFNTSVSAVENANSINSSTHLIIAGAQLTIPDANGSAAQYTTTTNASSSNAARANTQVAAPATSTTTTTTRSANTTPSRSASTSRSTNHGSSKSAVLSQMASRTGVSSSTWNTIISRESNWQPSVRNTSSGAYGLFQNMHISGGSVQSQVDAAVSLYHSQGLGAWK